MLETLPHLKKYSKDLQELMNLTKLARAEEVLACLWLLSVERELLRPTTIVMGICPHINCFFNLGKIKTRFIVDDTKYHMQFLQRR